MYYRELGNTQIEVSVIGMGCWALAGDWVWGAQEEAESLATVRAALDAGVTLFDTAEGYGDGYSEEVLGRALNGRRREAVIATKVSRSNLSADQIPRSCGASLRRLQTDYIDLYQIHWPNWDIPIEETFGALEKLRQQGKVRAIGVCNFGVRDLSDLLAVGHCAANQLPYSLLWRAIEFEVQPKCAAEDVGILCYSPLAQGLLTGKFRTRDDVPEGRARTRHYSSQRPLARHGEDGCEEETFAAIEDIRRICQDAHLSMGEVALAWLLAQQGVTSVLAGARHPDQVRENARGADLALPSEIVSRLTSATDSLKRKLGPNIDPYQPRGRVR